MKASMTKLELPADDGKRGIRWFSPTGCVEQREDTYHVFVGGTLVGTFDSSDATMRNVLAVTLSRDPDAHLGRMAKAFRMSSERLRQLRRKMEEGGLAALTVPAKNGRPAKVTPKIRAKLEAMFEQGLTIEQAHKKMRRLGKSTVGAVHTAWNAKKNAQQAQTPPAATQVTLPGVKRMAPPPPREVEPVIEEPVRGGSFVQHAGSWLMLGMLREQGLHAAATRACEERVQPEALRVAFDAVAVALTLGQSCVEGVRRVATPSSPVLLRARTCPSPRTVRAIMRELSDELGAVKLHVGMLARYLQDADRRASGVFYVDNHLRPYTGKRVVRRGWRMQDKRVRPGNTDYYVHDERGRPLFRIDVPSHDSLTQWLTPSPGCCVAWSAPLTTCCSRSTVPAHSPTRWLVCATKSSAPSPTSADRSRCCPRAPSPRRFASSRTTSCGSPSRASTSALDVVACGASPFARPTVARSICSPSRSGPQSASSRSCADAGAKRMPSSTASSDGGSTSSIGEAPSRTRPTPSCPIRRDDASIATCVQRPFARATLGACSPCSARPTDVALVSSATSPKR